MKDGSVANGLDDFMIVAYTEGNSLMDGINMDDLTPKTARFWVLRQTGLDVELLTKAYDLADRTIAEKKEVLKHGPSAEHHKVLLECMKSDISTMANDPHFFPKMQEELKNYAHATAVFYLAAYYRQYDKINAKLH